MQNLVTILLISLLSISANSQNKDAIKVYDFDSEPEILKSKAPQLDNAHPNLLNPQISKTEYETVMESWTKLHQEMASFLKAKDFEWETEDEQILIVHKFYFDADGNIHTYVFNLLNEDIDEQQRQTYSNLVSEFAETYSIGLKRDKQFAQCGKTRQMNQNI
ncbi:hypothetical protein MKO06_02575 [Gramella sp. GC03-9]|uniref:Uncharacterized protein n=1 Tax=Christiangramia oceanisediminis TaxID=2920386 RepID=A0A9X2I2R4_9FLAO|nr:hypothetical protein [Gramella oceanisediminis]MCP9198775.1 hypothetical protein [Gramella oceanisediminis]